MGALNKERIVFLIAVVIAIYGIATSFSGNLSMKPVPDVPPPGANHSAPPMNLPAADFMERDFNSYWRMYALDESRDPWVESKKIVNVTARMLPMRQPEVNEAEKFIPPTPQAPLMKNRPVLRQRKPPVAIETAPQEDEKGDGG